MATSIGRAIAFPARVDPVALAAALETTLTDLPFLAGRLGGMKRLRLSSLAIWHTGEGVPLTIVQAEGVTLDALAPQHWPRAGVTIAQPAWPWYLERMDVGKRWVGGSSRPTGVSTAGGAAGCMQHVCSTMLVPRPARPLPCPPHALRGTLPSPQHAGCSPAKSR